MAKIKIEREGDCLEFSIDNDKAEEIIVEIVTEKFRDAIMGMKKLFNTVKEQPAPQEPEEEPTEESESKATDYMNLPMRDRDKIKEETKALFREGAYPSKVKGSILEEKDIRIKIDTLREWARQVRKEEKEEEPETSEPTHSGGRQKNPAREEAIELLEKGKEPMEVFKILKKKHDNHPTLNLVHQWNYKSKKAKESAPEEKKEEPQEPTPSEESKSEKGHKDLEEDMLLIVEGIVMCPKYNRGVMAGGCATCVSYTDKIESNGELFVKCAEAKIEL